MTGAYHSDCIHCKDDGYFCGYRSISCEIHGNIEAFDNPYHNIKANECKDFECYSWMNEVIKRRNSEETEKETIIDKDESSMYDSVMISAELEPKNYKDVEEVARKRGVIK